MSRQLRTPDSYLGPFREGAATTVTATIRDEAGQAIAVADIDAITYTLYYETAPDTIINSREDVNLIAAVDANGLLTLDLTAADMPINDAALIEYHRCLISWRWDGTKTGSWDIRIAMGGPIPPPPLPAYSALDLMTVAFRLLGVVGEAQQPQAEEARTGLLVLNAWVDSLTIRMGRPVQVSQFANLVTKYELGTGYVRAIWYNLAIELAGHYPGTPPSDDVRRLAASSFADLRRANYTQPTATFEVARLGRAYGYDIYTDTSNGGTR